MLVTLEGQDGSGKSSHIEAVVDCLRAANVEVVRTREPGGTAIGESLRELLLHQAMTPETETLLMIAARVEHVREVIAPALARGAWVVCDRFSDSTMAYQCGGKGVSESLVEGLLVMFGVPQPALTLLFDVETEVASERRAAARTADKFEREEAAFFSRVRKAYLDIAAGEPNRVRVIDAGQSIEAVRAEALQHIDAAIGGRVDRVKVAGG